MTENFDPALGPEFAARLLQWFSEAMRPLPWRETYDPYSVWISEIMLQQTQMERGVRYFNAWMRRFPDIRSVAEAEEGEILAAWEGLGYYSRARNLHAAAKQILERHGGVIPQSVEAIRALPGVGEYTAGAIAAIAFNTPVPAVDANVLRIFSRICDVDAPVTGKDVRSSVTDLVNKLIPDESPRLFNQALMEFGALVCGKTPKCQACALSGFCLAFRNGTVSDRPKKGAATRYNVYETVAGIIMREGRVYIQKRPAEGLWAGMWEFPGGRIHPDETPEQAVVSRVLEETTLSVEVEKELATVRHGYTTNRVTMRGFLCQLSGSEPQAAKAAIHGAWIAPEEVEQYAFPAGHRKLLERLGWKGGPTRRQTGGSRS